MDLSAKDTNQLENVRADELVGPNPSFEHPMDDNHIRRFVTWMFIYDECKKKFRDEHTVIWSDMYQTNKNINWLDYYKGVLIKEIRDIRLKKLIK